MLNVSEVSQVFRTGFWMKASEVLHRVSLQLPERSTYGFLGANGAGKTTLISLIVGLRLPTQGTVEVYGQASHLRSARSRIGYLPERPYFPEHLSVEGFLKYMGVLSGLSNSQIRDRIPQVLSAVGMPGARNIQLAKCSKGMLQRVGIAQAILHDPEFLVLDEPMSGLDPLGRKEIRELILSLSREGRTVFFSSHVIPDVESICDQVALIQKGRLIGCGPIEQLLSDGSSRMEIGFKGLSEQQARSLPALQGVERLQEGWRGTVPKGTEFSLALQAMLSQNAEILWTQPVRTSLEDLFAREDRS